MATLTSKLIVQLLDRVTGPAKAVSASLNALTAASARNSARLSAISGKLLGTGAAAFALGKGLGAPIKVGAQFESLLEDIRQKGSLAAPELKALGLSLRNIASATNALPLDTVKSFSELLGLGLGGSDSENISAALKMLPAINRVATAYRASSDDVARAGQAAFMNLKVPAAEVGAAFDAMASAGKAGAFDLKNMAHEFPSLTASAQALKMSGVDGVAIARVATGRHGSCDACLAGVFTRHIAQFSDNPEDPAVLRAIWRLAEANVIEMLTSGPAYLAIKSLGVELQDAKEMTGEAVHNHIEPFITFGSQPTTTE